MFRIIQKYGFIFGLILVVGLVIGNMQSMEKVSLLGASNKWLLIAVIFGFQGLGLSKDSISQSFKTIQLPIFVLFWNFLGFPLIVASTLLWWINSSLKMGFFFLSIVPTTIALSVAYTDLSGGRVSGALISTCISNLIGAFLVPFVFIVFIGMDAGGQSQITQMVSKIIFMLIVPVLFGYGIRHCLPLVARYCLPIKKIAVEILLLVLIYNALADCLCQSSSSAVFLNDFILCLGICFLLFLVINALVWKSSQSFPFDRESRIAAFFAASHKSVCSGIPLILLTISSFSKDSEQAMVLLPLIAYYFFQVCFGAFMTDRFRQKN